MAFDLDTATDATTFNVFDFVSGAAVPEDDFTIYTDADAALKLARIFAAEAAARADENAGIADEPLYSEDHITELHERLVASKLVFHMKGLTPLELSEVEDTLKERLGFVDGQLNESFYSGLNNTIVAKSIVSVTNSAGAVDKNKWTPDMVKTFVKNVYVSEGNKLYVAASELTYVGAIFDGAVSADFS